MMEFGFDPHWFEAALPGGMPFITGRFKEREIVGGLNVHRFAVDLIPLVEDLYRIQLTAHGFGVSLGAAIEIEQSGPGVFRWAGPGPMRIEPKQ